MKLRLILFSFLVLSFLVACGPKAPEGKLQAFIEKHVAKVEPLMTQASLAEWEATTTGKKEAYDQVSRLEQEIADIYSDKGDFEFLKRLKEKGEIKDPLLARQLTILYNAYAEHQVDPELQKEIITKSAEIRHIFDTFRAKIDGKEVTDNRIYEILATETNRELRKKAWEASKQVGAAVAPKLIELVKLRNKAAKALGYNNYYEMELTLSEIKPEELTSIMAKLKELSDEPFKKLKGEIDKKIAAKLMVSVDELRPWDYEDPFFQEPPRIYDVNLDAYFKGRNPAMLAANTYKSMGLVVNDIIKRSDLFEKPGKEQHAFTINIDRKQDIRILANIRTNERWTATMLHELGHAVYDKYINGDLPYLLREPSHAFTTEAIAMMFERLTRNPNWLKVALSLPDEEYAKLEEPVKSSLRLKALVFARWCQVMVNFERELYKNPDQDLNKLWWDMVERYQFVHRPEGRDAPDWAAKIHFTTAPVYYHNYMLGDLMASQLVSYIKDNVLKVPSTWDVYFYDQRDAGRYLVSKIFRSGASLRWDELLKKATGESLNPEYFIKEFVTEQ